MARRAQLGISVLMKDEKGPVIGPVTVGVARIVQGR
jgi:hypothetical protein